MPVEHPLQPRVKRAEDQLDLQRLPLDLRLLPDEERNNTPYLPDGKEKWPKMARSKITIDSFAAVRGDWAICLFCVNGRMDLPL